MASSSPTFEQFYAILARVIATIAAVVHGINRGGRYYVTGNRNCLERKLEGPDIVEGVDSMADG